MRLFRGHRLRESVTRSSTLFKRWRMSFTPMTRRSGVGSSPTPPSHEGLSRPAVARKDDDNHKQASPQPNISDTGSLATLSPLFWVLVVVTGVGAGLGAAALMGLLRAVQHLAWAYHSGDFLSATKRSSPERRVIVLFIAGLFAGIGWLLLRRSTKEGSGLTEAIWLRAGQMPLWRTLGNAVLSIVIVGLGASIGREAAPKEVGAGLASVLAKWGRLSPAQRRLLVACGAGAGMAAVYNVPFGGALFAVEVLLGTLSLPLVLPALATSLIATAISWIALPIRPTYSMPSHALMLPEIVWAALIGPLAGLAAVAYIRLIAWAKAHKPQGWHLVMTTLVVFTALGLTAIAYPELLGNGRDVVQEAFTNQLSLLLLGVIFVLKPLATASCFRSGATGGLFTPTLTYGALLGGLLGHIWSYAWPGASLGSYAIVGAGAVLAAATQGPVSAIALMLDLTHHIETLMVPLLLAVTGAVLVTRLFEKRSIYSANVHP
jgi:CIC family chloride channel protein